MSDDYDALLARADNWRPRIQGWIAKEIVTDLAAAVRELLADRIAALDVIARLTTGWEIVNYEFPERHTWYLEPGIDDGPETDDLGNQPMSEREWRVFCDAAQRATRNTT